MKAVLRICSCSTCLHSGHLLAIDGVVTKAKELVCWLEEGQVVLELLEMVEGGGEGAELFGPDSWLLSKHLNL